MAKRALQIAVLGLPLIALAIAAASACSSDPELFPDASVDQRTPDDGGGSDVTTSDVNDGGPITDAKPDTGPPPLCRTYPNAFLDAAAAPVGVDRYYELIAYKSLLDAIGRCEIASHFQAVNDAPNQFDCYAKQLASTDIAGCAIAGDPIVYSLQRDKNGNLCNPDSGANSVGLALRIPGSADYTANDVDFFADVTKAAALDAGMAAADADRLKTLLLAQQKTVVFVDAGPGDAGFSMSTCP